MATGTEVVVEHNPSLQAATARHGLLTVRALVEAAAVGNIRMDSNEQGTFFKISVLRAGAEKEARLESIGGVIDAKLKGAAVSGQRRAGRNIAAHNFDVAFAELPKEQYQNVQRSGRARKKEDKGSNHNDSYVAKEVAEAEHNQRKMHEHGHGNSKEAFLKLPKARKEQQVQKCYEEQSLGRGDDGPTSQSQREAEKVEKTGPEKAEEKLVENLQHKSNEASEAAWWLADPKEAAWDRARAVDQSLPWSVFCINWRMGEYG